MKNILIVEDEKKIRDVVSSYLEKEGYNPIEAENGSKAIEILSNSPIDLVILDLMLPDTSGEEICKRIRRGSAIPIIMLTAKASEDDRIQGLSLGADDYVVKPFSPRELVARVKAIIRRTSEDTLLADRIEFDNGYLVIDTLQHEVYVKDKIVSLTPNEYKMLLVLARHPERPFKREELIEKALGFDYEGEERTIDQHIKNLRQKIEPDPKQPQFIVTVFGVGYRFAGGEK
ncbi:response regulator transcription factor [Paenibacillus alginolyticus]|uniref:Response regulator transcription factor n=1 Tax=Paenibacillus alginolyticus TaxID=59839 RepID=A0ABT4GBA2_9BACL|nr:response regulator transcription factor [Paenibacillus alginolyticus]MCY9693378.1 response regulator transcription factor [Paenibacillus alginolyticus]MEC0144637.1 response regulator transcription factor [Paenibacillus alginolyticus]